MNDTTKIFKKLLLATHTEKAVELAEKLNISSQAIYKALKAEKIPKRWIKTVAELSSTNEEWFYEGIEQPIKPKNTTCEDVVMVPLVKARLSAGGGSLETSGVIEKEYAFKRDFFDRKGNPSNMVLMRVSGDSMEPEVFDNDIVLIDQSKTEVLASKIYAVSFEDCIYLKRVDLLPRQIALKSTNPAYPPVILDISDNMDHLFKIVGRVLWMSRDYS